ncbi:glycosyltransferase [Kaistella sp.]|uniref:glycosyltransferase n=1 Tax=Kaistella sp. TaxID=2782235 RepID=UPI0035A1AA6F
MSKLAIVIPYYKIEFFNQCLKSLNNQSNKNFTVYIGDDFSDKDPSDIINLYNNTLSIKYTRFSNNLGHQFLTKQWDRCIDLTENEEWIMLLGDDDMISENLVEDFYENLNEINENNYQLLRANVTEINDVGETLRSFKYPRTEKAAESYIKKITQNYHISLPEYIFRKKSYEKYGFKHFPFAFGSDNVAWLEFSEGKDIYTLPHAWCIIRTSELSISGNSRNINEKIYAMYLTKKYIINNLFNEFIPIQKTVIISEAYQNLLFYNKKLYKERFTFVLKNMKYLTLSQSYNFFFKL